MKSCLNIWKRGNNRFTTEFDMTTIRMKGLTQNSTDSLLCKGCDPRLVGWTRTKPDEKPIVDSNVAPLRLAA